MPRVKNQVGKNADISYCYDLWYDGKVCDYVRTAIRINRDNWRRRKIKRK